MNEMKPEDVMRALELHADCETDNCFECPYEGYLSKADGNCVHHLSIDALALLREKDALLAEWDAKLKSYEIELLGKDAEIERLKKERDLANAEREANVKGFAEEMAKISVETDALRSAGNSLKLHLEAARAENAELLEDIQQCMYYAKPKNNNTCNFCKRDGGEGGHTCKGREDWVDCSPIWRGVTREKMEGDK